MTEKYVAKKSSEPDNTDLVNYMYERKYKLIQIIPKLDKSLYSNCTDYIYWFERYI